MRTLGIDLAADPKNTALCEIEWDEASVTVLAVARNVSDAQILDLAAGPPSRVIGVDIPFGWPTNFVTFVSAHARGATPLPSSSMRQKRLRSTDTFIQDRFSKTPLSVSTDKIGIPAMRWAALSHDLGIVNRAGNGQFYEVYPAVARIAWGLRGKDKVTPLEQANAIALEQLLRALRFGFARPGIHEELLENEHCFDALLCALATRAAALGLTYPPPSVARATAEVEGWIHAPQPGTLDQLISAEFDQE